MSGGMPSERSRVVAVPFEKEQQNFNRFATGHQMLP